MRHALILAGGSGTRLWPYSTAGLPKQLVPLLQGRSLLDVAVERATSCVPAERVWLGAGEQLRAAVSQVPGLQADRLVVEPSARDTLPAVALGCAVIAANDPDAVVAVLTADHLIEPLESFSQTLDAAFTLAEQQADALVTFGVVPDAPATGFGYLELGDPLGAGRVVTRFQEKPTLSRAAEFLAAGPDQYLWNSGMFVWQAQTLLRAVDEFSPHAGLVLRAMGHAYGTPRWEPLSRDAWPTVAKLSVDYGVMEPALDVAGLHRRRAAAGGPLARRRVLARVRRGARPRRRRQRGRRRPRGAARQPRQRRRLLRPRPPGDAGRLRGAGRRAHAERDAGHACRRGATGQGAARAGRPAVPGAGVRSGDAVALTGYALATPFVVWPPLFKHMWNRRDTRLLAVQETGVALVVAGWAARGDTRAVGVNAAYGVGLAVAWVAAGRRRGGPEQPVRVLTGLCGLHSMGADPPVLPRQRGLPDPS